MGVDQEVAVSKMTASWNPVVRGLMDSAVERGVGITPAKIAGRDGDRADFGALLALPSGPMLAMTSSVVPI